MSKSVRIFIFSIFVFLSSCTPVVRFGISQKYYINDSEREGILEQSVIDKYETIVNIDTLNVPLNKIIYGEKYKVYIGVSFYNKAVLLYSIYSSDSMLNQIATINNKSDVSMFSKKGSHFFYFYLFDCEKDNLTYVLTLESDSLSAKEKFDSSFLINKIQND